MSVYASDSTPVFVLFGDSNLIKKFLSEFFIKSSVDSTSLNITEENSTNSDSSIHIVQSRFLKNNKYSECKFVCESITNQKEHELLAKIYNCFLDLKLPLINGFILLIDGSDFSMPYSNVENHVKCLKFLFNTKDLNKRIAICYFNFHGDYKLIYTYQKRLLRLIFEENFTFECFNMKDRDSFLEFFIKCYNMEHIHLNLNDLRHKIIKELSYQTSVSANLLYNLKEIGDADSKYRKSSNKSSHFNVTNSENPLGDHYQNGKLVNKKAEPSNLTIEKNQTTNFPSASHSTIYEKSFPVDQSQQSTYSNSTANFKNETFKSSLNPNKATCNQKHIFLILGESGSGKTTFINYLANYFEGTIDFEIAVKNPNEFKIAINNDKNWNSSMIERFIQTSTNNNIRNSHLSQTSDCREYEFKLNSEYDSIIFIDTPGFNDTNGITQDAKNLEKIKNACLKNKSINGVILMINGSLSRKNLNMIDCIESIFQILPNNLRKEISLILTNCQSELDCNFKPNDYFQKSLKINDTYNMQNSFLKWDKNNQLKTRQKRDMKDNWDQSYSEIEKLIKKIVKLESNSTESIMQIQDSELAVEQMIRGILNKVKDLFQSYFDMKCKEKAKIANYEIMISNLNEYKYKTINAIPLDPYSRYSSRSTNYSPRVRLSYPQVKQISIKLDDNETKHKYKEAFNQHEKYSSDIKDIGAQENSMVLEMENFVEEIQTYAKRLFQINSRYNFATKFCNDLLELKQFVERKLNEVTDLKYSFYKIEELISKVFKILQ